GSRIAYVFYRRVQAEAERYVVSTPFVLACAIAHEVGHLLMPGGGHSRDGIMRACWNRDDFHRADQSALRFSDDQVVVMRAQHAGASRRRRRPMKNSRSTELAASSTRTIAGSAANVQSRALTY